MPRQTDEFEVFAHLDTGVIAEKWVLDHCHRCLSVTSADRKGIEFRATYDESNFLVLSLLVDGKARHHQKTLTRLSSEESTSGARLLLELALYMLNAGELVPGDISEVLAPRKS